MSSAVIVLLLLRPVIVKRTGITFFLYPSKMASPLYTAHEQCGPSTVLNLQSLLVLVRYCLL